MAVVFSNNKLGLSKITKLKTMTGYLGNAIDLCSSKDSFNLNKSRSHKANVSETNLYPIIYLISEVNFYENNYSIVGFFT